MRFQILLVSLFFSLTLGLYTSTLSNHSLDIQPLTNDDDNDRGTLILYCRNAEDACNNACYDHYCRNRGLKFTKAENEESAKNNFLSGCKAAAGGSVCAGIPFAQLFSFPKDLKQPSCDEWPPATVKQDHPTRGSSLRCMEQVTNRNAGNIIGQFVNGAAKFTPPQPMRKGMPSEKVHPGQTFSVQFNLEKTRPEDLPYCQPNRDCKNDGFEFKATSVTDNNGHGIGRISTPYKYDDNNHYALSNEDGGDIKQCYIQVAREEQDGRTHFTVILSKDSPEGKNGDRIGKVEGFPTHENPLLAMSSLNDNAVIMVSPESPGIESNIHFSLSSNLRGHLSWNLKDKLKKGDGNPKPYCEKVNVKIYASTESLCAFPCLYAP